MGQPRNADQLLHGGGLGFIQHAAHEGRAKFGQPQRSGGAVDLLRRNAQRLRPLEQGHNVLIVQRNRLVVDAGNALKHMHHGRIVVTQDIQLDQDVMHGVKVVVRGDDAAFVIVRRVLNGGKLADIVSAWKHHHAARMLSCSALDPHAASDKAVFFSFARHHAAFFQIFHYITIGCFIRQRADGAGAEYIARAKQLLHVGARLGLILAGEAQVNIGHLVAFEAQEHLKRDIEAILGQLLPADGAIAIGQIHAHCVAFRNIKPCLAAMLAAIVRRQRVHLGDAAHGSHQRRANRAAAAYQVAV